MHNKRSERKSVTLTSSVHVHTRKYTWEFSMRSVYFVALKAERYKEHKLPNRISGAANRRPLFYCHRRLNKMFVSWNSDGSGKDAQIQVACFRFFNSESACSTMHSAWRQFFTSYRIQRWILINVILDMAFERGGTPVGICEHNLHARASTRVKDGRGKSADKQRSSRAKDKWKWRPWIRSLCAFGLRIVQLVATCICTFPLSAATPMPWWAPAFDQHPGDRVLPSLWEAMKCSFVSRVFCILSVSAIDARCECQETSLWHPNEFNIANCFSNPLCRSSYKQIVMCC